MAFDEQSNKDLEFDRICELLAVHCKSAKAKKNAQNLKPFESAEQLSNEFNLLQEIRYIH